MSAVQAKAARRDVRRAFGPAAIDVLNGNAAAVQELQQRFSELAGAHVIAVKCHDALVARVHHLEGIINRPLLGRLRWLLTGK